MPEIDDAVILNVRTFRRTDSEPSIDMDVPELNAFEDEDQPDDTSFEGYAAGEFDEANRIEMHADWYNDETEAWERIIDGEEASWDSTNAEISFDLARAHTPEVGQYRFEWVLVEDEPDATTGEVPTSTTAEHVNTIPIENYYGYRVTSATARELGAREPVNRTVGTLTVEDYARGANGPLMLAASPPTDPYHSTHRQFVESGLAEKADTDGAGTATLSNYQSIESSEVSNTVGDAQLQAAWDGLVVPVASGLGMANAIDPTTSAQPVQDAVDAVSAAGGGKVLLPPETVDHDGSLALADFTSIYGVGWGGATSEINFTHGGDGLLVPSTGAARYGELRNFRVTNGPGLGGTASGHGFAINGSLRQFDVNLRFDGWDNDVINWSGGGNENRFQRIAISNCDAGAATALVNNQGAGSQNWIGTLAISASADASGADSTCYRDDAGGDLRIEQMHLGGTISWAVDRRGSRSLSVGQIQYEPLNQIATPDRIVFQGVERPLRVGYVRVVGAAENCYFLNNGDADLGRIFGAGNLTGDVVRVNTDIAAPAVYHGDSANVNNGTGGALTHAVSCLGDLTQVG